MTPPQIIEEQDVPLGAVILCRGRGLLADFIQCVEEPSEYSHSGLWDGSHLIHSRGEGVKRESLSDLMNKQKEFAFVDAYALVDGYAPHAAKIVDLATRIAKDEHSDPKATIFDLKDLVLAGLISATRRPEVVKKCLGVGLLSAFCNLPALKKIGAGSKKTPPTGRLACAEFVALCFRDAGAPIRVDPTAVHIDRDVRFLDQEDLDNVIKAICDWFTDTDGDPERWPGLTPGGDERTAWGDTWQEALLRYLLTILVDESEWAAAAAFLEATAPIAATGARIRFVSPGLLRTSPAVRLIGRIPAAA